MKRSRVLPLIALCSVFAYFASAQSGDPGGPGENEPQVPCVNCAEDGWLARDKTAVDPACQAAWQGEADLRYYVGRCMRYACTYGHYYAFDGWYALPLYNCTDIVVNDPDTCPHDSCQYIPWVSDPHASIAGSSCGSSKPGNQITTGDAARLNRKAMLGDAK